VIFNNLKGFPGWRLCDSLVRERDTQAIAMGTTPENVSSFLASHILDHGPGKSQLVEDGPCKEVKLIGEDADIFQVPIPIHSEGDGGRFIGSGITITKDPDTGIRNEAFLRAQLKTPRKTCWRAAPRHTWGHYMKYEKRGEPMPMAFAIGVHPAYEIFTAYTGRHEGFDELEFGAGLLGETLEMVKCETVDLEVPAHAEVVIEGIAPPGVREPEGPFGEFTNYNSGYTGEAPIFEITAITHRRDPIFRHIQAVSFTDHQQLGNLIREAVIFRRLSEMSGQPRIRSVFMPGWASNFIVMVQLSPQWDGQAKNVLLGALSSPYLEPKIAIAVDEDVNIYDPKDVFWAISTRVNPEKDVMILENQRNHHLDPISPEITPPEGDLVLRMGGKMIIDATKPAAWRKQEREQFTRVVPSGANDPAIQGILDRLRVAGG
jgi:2,5-furandicarboxylate decarboxylase 1